MSKIYSYAEFQKIAKVGMRVRAVEGMENGCASLRNNGSNAQAVTHVSKNTFAINGCTHNFQGEEVNNFLELLDDEPEQPERGEITWDTLECGDVVIDKDYPKVLKKVIDVGINRKVFGIESDNSLDGWVACSLSYLKQYCAIIQPTKLETISLADAEKALGKRIIIT